MGRKFCHSTKCLILYHFVLCTWCCFTNHFRRLYVYIYILHLANKKVGSEDLMKIWYVYQREYVIVFFLVKWVQPPNDFVFFLVKRVQPPNDIVFFLVKRVQPPNDIVFFSFLFKVHHCGCLLLFCIKLCAFVNLVSSNKKVQ